MIELNILASKEEQLKVLVPYLEEAATTENPKPLPMTNRSIVLAARILRDWKPYILPREAALTTEGAFRYYLRLQKGE